MFYILDLSRQKRERSLRPDRTARPAVGADASPSYVQGETAAWPSHEEFPYQLVRCDSSLSERAIRQIRQHGRAYIVNPEFVLT
jgi:hypothetical protein